MTAPRFPDSLAAEAAFYAAFESGDPAAMRAVWDAAEDIVCVHPMGPPLQGTGAVHDSWRQLLGGGGRMRFEPLLIHRYAGPALAVHHLYERIRFGEALTERSVVIATNVYRNTACGWRMVSHHGSPGSSATRVSEPPDAVH